MLSFPLQLRGCSILADATLFVLLGLKSKKFDWPSFPATVALENIARAKTGQKLLHKRMTSPRLVLVPHLLAGNN